MKHLALILSKNHDRLNVLNAAALRAGFSVNCLDKYTVARQLIERYTNDYHIMLIDEDALGRNCAPFVSGIQEIAPKSRIVVMTAPGSTLAIKGEMLTLCPLDRATLLLPRLKREVTLHRTAPVQRDSA